MDSNGFGDEHERALILKVHPGLLSRVAERLGMSPAAVSRTFHGITRELNPKIVEALNEAISYARRRNTR
jgi:predicted transcriptional regulator